MLKRCDITSEENLVGDRLLTINEVAELTGLAVGTLYHLVSQGRIPVVRLSRRCLRFRLSRILHWWDELSQPVRDGHAQAQIDSLSTKTLKTRHL